MATNNLGTAEGRIVIDVSQLATAGEVIKQFAATAMANLAPLATMFANIATITKTSSSIMVQQLKNEATEVSAAADIEIAAINAKTSAETDATKLSIQLSKERIAQLEAEADVAADTAQKSGQLSNPGAKGLSRAAFSVGFAASSLGLQGVGQAAFGIGGLTAVVGELPVFTAQLQALAATLTGMGGLIGQVAAIGATLAGSMGAILAVAAPIAALFIGLALVVKRFADAAKDAADRLKAATDKATAAGNLQVQVNQAIAGGATTEDIQQQITDARKKRTLDVGTFGDLSSLRDSVAARGNDTTILDAQLDAVGKAIGQDNATIEAWEAAINSVDAANNSVLASYNALAKAEDAEAQFRQQLAGENSKQLTKQLSDAQANAQQLQSLVELSSGKQKDEYQAQLDALNGVTDASGKYVVVQGQIKDIQEALAAANIREFWQGVSDFLTHLRDLASSFGTTTQRTSEDRAIAATNRVFDNLEQQARAADDFIRQRSQELADFAKSQERSAHDFALAEAKSLRDFNENKAKAQKQYDEETEQREKDHQDKIAKIMSDSRLKILEAAANLDARAVYNEQQRRNQAIADENDNYTKDKEQRQKAFEEQLADQQKQYDEQRQDAQDQYDLQRQRAIDDFNERLAREDQQRALQLQRQAQDYALQNQRQSEQYALLDARRLADMQAQVAQLVQHYLNLQEIARVGLAGLASQFLGFFLGSGGMGSGIPTGTPFPQIGAGGASAGQSAGDVHLHGDIVLGDIGNRSDSEVMQLIDRGLRQFFHSGLQRRGNT